jgi:hypothetical protein
VETRAPFGYTAPIATTDEGRFRRLTVHIPPQCAQRPFNARNTGAGDQQMRQIVAEELKEIYFQEGGSRTTQLSDVTLNDIDLPRHRLLASDRPAGLAPAAVTGRFSWRVRGRVGELSLSPRSMGRKGRTASVQAPDQIGSQRSGIAGVPAARVGVEREASY